MAEFLKNNPIALRHCLLYVFLQESSAEKAFTEFCGVIGEDVIKKEELEFWFDKFKNRIFDIEKDKKPIIDMRDVLRSDKNALRVCILYESLKMKHPEFKKHNEFIHLPAFSEYKHFCKVIGENVMEYQEFDFWFWRFDDGVLELKSERDKIKKIYELSDMPLDVMENIVESLGIADRLSLERTSESLRSFSQNQKVFHGEFKFGADRHSIYISFGACDVITYKNKGDDCEVEFRNSKKVIRGVSFLKQAFQDFKKILENPRLYLHTLTISFLPWRMTIDSLEEQMRDALKFTHLLHVNNIAFRRQSMKTFLSILPSLKPGYLTTITIGVDLDETTIAELVEMDQWRQAKYLYMGAHLFVGPLRHLSHFHKFTVAREELFIDDVREMKEILFDSPDFDGCILSLDIPVEKSDDPMVIRRVFGGTIEGSNDIFHYPIPKSTEYFEIRVNFDIIKIEKKKK